MNQTLAVQIGSLVTNDSNWQPFNVLTGLTSGISPSGNLQYSTWNSTPASSNYTYLRYNGEKSQLFSSEAKASLDSNFRPDIFSYAGSCTYPISGQYGFLNRLLFYLLMIFALVARRRTWLAAAALGTAMTYAASAAVHAFALLARYNYNSISIDDYLTNPQKFKAKDFGDLDLQGIYPILVASCVMLTPILNWSVEIREHARAIAVYWGLLMFTALVPTLVKFLNEIYPFTDSDQLFTCDVDVTKNCTLDFLNSIYSSNFYNKCNCNDTCGAVSLPDAPFRHGQNLQAYVLSDRTQGLLDKNAVSRLFAINTCFLCFIVVHGILGLLEVDFTQAELRNKMFLLLAGNKSYSERASIGSKTRYHIAKSISLSFFVGAIVAAIICPAVYVSSVIINEINTWAFPVAERPDAIGQWGTYVGAAFVLIAAVIQRYHLAWLRLLELVFSETWRLSKWAFSGFNGGETNFRREPVEKARNDNNSVLENIRDFFIQCMRPLTHAGRSILHSWRRVSDEWEDCRLWWNHPIHRSQQPHYRRPEKHAYDMPPLPNVSKYIKRAATTPMLPSSLSPQIPKGPTVMLSPTLDTSFSPRLPSNSRIASPQPVAGVRNPLDEPPLAQDTIQKQTFQRRATGK